MGPAWTERAGDWGRRSGVLLPLTPGGDHLLTFNGWRFRNGQVQARLRLNGPSGTLGLGLRLGGYGQTGLPTRGLLVEIDPAGLLKAWRVQDWTLLGQTALPGFTPGAWLSLGVEVSGSTLTATVGGQAVLQIQDPTLESEPEGEVGIWSHEPPAPEAHAVDTFTLFPQQIQKTFTPSP